MRSRVWGLGRLSEQSSVVQSGKQGGCRGEVQVSVREFRMAIPNPNGERRVCSEGGQKHSERFKEFRMSMVRSHTQFIRQRH